MESASVLGVLSSWEVIAAGLLLMLLLPVVFTVASLKSPARRPAAKRGRTAAPLARRATSLPRTEESGRAVPGPRPARPPREPADGDAEDES